MFGSGEKFDRGLFISLSFWTHGTCAINLHTGSQKAADEIFALQRNCWILAWKTVGVRYSILDSIDGKSSEGVKSYRDRVLETKSMLDRRHEKNMSTDKFWSSAEIHLEVCQIRVAVKVKCYLLRSRTVFLPRNEISVSDAILFYRDKIDWCSERRTLNHNFSGISGKLGNGTSNLFRTKAVQYGRL